jgi:glutamate/tyrosine decarboxylase-like PLP-dependent enzyme
LLLTCFGVDYSRMEGYMKTKLIISEEETLDPEDWDAMRVLGHRMVDDMIDYMKKIRERPVWRHMPDDAKARFSQPLPCDPQPPGDVYAEFLEDVLPYPIGNDHPRFWGWLFGTGTVMGAYAEFLAGAMNTNAGDIDHHSAIHVQKQVVDWFKEMLGYPESASGLLTSGCSAANLIALAVARNANAGYDLREDGLGGGAKRMVVYASEEIHSSIKKAVELLGLGNRSLRRVPINQGFQVDLEALKAMIAADREAGMLPFCAVGAAGTTNTGAFDDLNGLADICQAEGLWLHVDGAFGAWAVLDPSVRDLVAGMDRADSLAFDLHKWMYMQFEIGCVLVRDAMAHRQAFSESPVYISRGGDGRGLTGGDLPWFTDLGFQMSTGFRALKAWMSLKEHGVHKYSRMVQQNLVQVRYLVGLIEETPELELMAPAPLNVVCFRYIEPGLGDGELETINKEILVRLQEEGVAVLSGSKIKGRYVMRLGHTNHRSRREDFDLLVQEVIRIGRQLSPGLPAAFLYRT